MIAVEYVAGGIELLDAVGRLWEQLNEHHGDQSPHFADEFARRTFAQRKADLLKKAADATFRVDLARDQAASRFVGYCISTVDQESVGEIDSIYVESGFRGLGIGDGLMQRALAWMDGLGIESKVVAVAFGNEEVFPFYSRYGFFPRTTILKQKE
jgi:ribosomal protein S18 acetylase RimI-like enzyme